MARPVACGPAATFTLQNIDFDVGERSVSTWVDVSSRGKSTPLWISDWLEIP
jgi:hypothetical protein